MHVTLKGRVSHSPHGHKKISSKSKRTCTHRMLPAVESSWRRHNWVSTNSGTPVTQPRRWKCQSAD